MHPWKKFFLLAAAVLIASFCTLPVMAEQQPADASRDTAFDPARDTGYLPEGMAPYIVNDWEKGSFLYITQDLRVEIKRYRRETPNKLVWYIADIQSENEAMHTYTFNEKKPGRTNGLPEDMAKAHKAVYAQNGDFYSYRIANNKTPGIIIRDGKILYKKTYEKAVLALPSLDTAAFFPDGNMKVFKSYQLTAKEYIDQGATDVLSFGPILIRDGIISPTMYTNFTHLEPRSAIGIISPGHYIGMLVEGRTDFSEGCSLQFVAETLAGIGCTDALNLDGGGTSAMVFMGQSVELGSGQGVTENARAIPDILAIGTYE